MSETIRTPDEKNRCPDCQNRDWDSWRKNIDNNESIILCESCGFSYTYDEQNEKVTDSTPSQRR